MISPGVVVVVSLKPERIRPVKFNNSGESFIWLKAGSCNKSGAAKIYQHSVYIKVVNIKGEKKCIIMGHNDPIRFYWGKGYGAVYKLSLFSATACVDNIYLGFNRGCSQKLPLLVF